MALDFLSSDIVFPSDSSEPKLATTTVSKLPGPVDWAFHDYYSTACEKASMPVHSITDYRQWTKHDEDNDEIQPSNRTKQDEQLMFLLSKRPSHTTTTAPPPPVPPSPAETTASNLRAALCGALEHVDNAMQDNHLTRLDKYSPGQHKEYCWQDEVLYGSLNFPPEASSGPNNNNAIFPQHDDIDDDFLHERRSFTDDEDGPALLDSSGLTSFITSSIHVHDQLPPEPAYYPPLAVPPSITRVETPPVVEGKPTIAKSKVWQGLVGRLKKNLSKPFKETPSSHVPPTQQGKLKRFFFKRQ
ncbi:hypothetical protein BJV82DRAFT_594060 [Fennellomyces sp. T-0311]|nr:hypothetical protein BJV82DRAFT_594060 [Fennellomyces sp. T-0311]